MADLSLRIKADFDEASRQFKELADASENTREKIAKFTEKFKAESVDKFIDKQNLAAIAMQATGRDTDAAKTQLAAYQREIERLIKSGLDPQDAALQKLQGEYSRLTREVEANEAAHKMQEKAVMAAKGALLGITAAIAAGAGIAIKAAAANEDMIAAFTPLMNGDVDKATALFKAIQKEAAVTPFEIDKIAASVRALMPAFGGSAEAATEAFRMLGDTAGGNAQKLESITSAYTKAMLKGKVSMQEINQIANAGVPIYSELAKSMGITEAKMMEMSKKGQITSADLTGAFRQMTSEGGIFFKGMETASDTFSMRLLGVKENMGILAGTVGEKLLPVAKELVGKVLDLIQGFNEWAGEGDNLQRLLEGLVVTLASVVAGLVAFKSALAIHALIQKVKLATDGLTFSVKALSAAIKANPIGLIATGVAAGVGILTAVIGNHIAKQREMTRSIKDTTEAMVQNTQAAAHNALVVGATEWLSDINNAITAYEQKLRQLAATQETMRRIDAGEILLSASEIETYRRNLEHETEALNNLKRSIDATLALSGRRYVNGAIQNITSDFQQMLDAIGKTTGQELGERINAVQSFLKQRADLERVEGEDRIQFFEQQKAILLEMFRGEGQEREAIAIAVTAAIAETEKKIADDAEKAAKEAAQARIRAAKEAEEALKLMLESIIPTEKRIKSQRIAIVQSFLQQQAELESDDFAERITFLEDQKAQLIEMFAEGSEERVAIELAANKLIKDEHKKLAEYEQELLEKRLGAFSGFFGAIASLIDASNEKSVGAFYFARTLASAEAFINSYLAFTKALNDPTPLPTAVRVAQAGAVLASGLAAQVNIWRKEPSFETGIDRFVVPDVSPRRVDGVGLRVNPGEEVSVTPRGMTGQESVFNINLLWDGQVLANAINKLARSGQLHTLQLAGNL